MKKKIGKYAIFGILFLLTILGIQKVNAETYAGQAIWPSEKISGVYIKKVRPDGYTKWQQASFIRRSEDNKFVYCLQPYVEIDNNYPPYNVARSDYASILNMTEEQWTRASLLAYYGYGYNDNGYNHSAQKWYAVTQVLIWRTVEPTSRIFFTDTLNGNEVADKFASEIAEIEHLVSTHYTRPNFESNNLTIPLGQTVNLVDSNNVLQYYEIVSTSNASASINGNTLTITSTGIGTASVNFRKVATKYDSPPVVYYSNHSQNVFRVGNYDPVPASLTIKVIGGKVTVEKLDSKTLLPTPRGDGNLNATYGVYDLNNNRVGQVVIGENALGTSDYLQSLGRFYLKEEISGLGYELDPNKYFFEVTEDNLNPKVKVYEQAIEREVQIFKVLANSSTTILKAEPNVTFEFYLKSSMELYETATTDSNGKLSVILPYGTYIVKQTTTTPNYEKVDDFEIVIDSNSEEPITKVISNAEITAKLKLIKVDSESNKIIAKTGIKFRIKNLSTNEYVCQNITYPSQQKICVFETDKNGMFVTPYVLSNGNYQIEELEEQTIDGYVWNSEPLKFSVTENSNFIYDKEFGVMLEVMFENKQVKAEVEINKIGEKLVIENGNFTYEEIKLGGVSYNLYADGDIYSQDGTLVYKDKELVHSFETIDGYYKITNLYLGKYCLVEQATDENHLLDSTPYCFTAEYKDQYTDIVSLSFTLKNYLKKGTLEYTKLDVSTSEPIPNTTIEIYLLKELEDNSIEETLVFTGTTDNAGKIVINNLFVGKFKIVEIQPNENYINSEEPAYFEILEDSSIVKASMTNERIPIEVPNTSIGDSKVLNIIVIGSIILGVGFLIYDKKRKK